MDASTSSWSCNRVMGLGCIIDIIRALKMDSCLSTDGSNSLLPYSSSWNKMKNVDKNGICPSFDSRWEQQLHKIPGRFYLNGASKVASLFTQQGKKGVNQDAMIVWENFGSRTDTVFCGIFDGHGPLGHFVAKRVRDSLPLKLSTHWQVTEGNDGLRDNLSRSVSVTSDETESSCVEEELRSSLEQEEKEKLPEIFFTLKDSFLKAFKAMDKELRFHPNVDCSCSGTTAVTLIKQGQDLVIANIGDSRAILGSRDEENNLIPVQLTVDLKPNVPSVVSLSHTHASAHTHIHTLKFKFKCTAGEAERIRRCKGRVFALPDEPEVSRVWLPRYDSPGLAMARAFGDFCLKGYGLISVPEVFYHRLTERDEFLVLASDGVWDVLSNKEVVDIVASAPSHSLAARYLVESAVRNWKFKYKTSKVDDCAVVCLFVNANSKTEDHVKRVKLDEDLEITEKLLGNDEDFPPSPVFERSDTVYDNCETVHEPNRDVSAVHLSKGGNSSPWQKIREKFWSAPRKQVGRKEGSVETGEWSALEGVTRVNTLLTLPSFVLDDKSGASDHEVQK